MKFQSGKISGLLINTGDQVTKVIHSINKTDTVVISQGYGTNCVLPLRFLAYVVPIWHLLEQLPNASAELYFALHGVLRANPHLLKKAAEHSIHLMIEAICSYGYVQHSTVTRHVHIYVDRDISGDHHALNTIEKLTDLAMIVGEQDSTISSFFNKRGGRAAYRYAAEHILYMRDPVELESCALPYLVMGMSQNLHHLIMVGGPSEKIFYKLRKIVAEQLKTHNQWQSHQFHTPIGDPPSYHHQPGEPLWEERATLPAGVHGVLELYRTVSATFGTQTATLRDFITLLIDAGNMNDFPLAQQWAREFLTDKLSVAVLNQLQAGWDRIRYL